MNKSSPLLRYTFLVASLMLGGSLAYAEALKPDTIYVNTVDALYEVDTGSYTASRIADVSLPVSEIDDMTIINNTLYGLSARMQFTRYGEATATMQTLNDPHSYDDLTRGMVSYYGTTYATGYSGLYTVDPNNDGFNFVGYFGLGAGEDVTDLAVSDSGVIYATVTFHVTSASDYLATLDPDTGAMNIIGNTYVYGTRGLTMKNGVLYAINSSGDLFTLNKTSGASTLLASGVVHGAYGMASTDARFVSSIAGNSGGNTLDNASGGSLSLLSLLIVTIMAGLHRRRSHAGNPSH